MTAKMKAPKRQDLPGFWLVGTPIGNRSDLTLRAQQTLAESDEIWCEDTRVTQKLLDFYKIKKPLERFDEAMFSGKIEKLTRRLLEGRKISFCSDAGMPGINDPGARIIEALSKTSIPIHVAPGVSAVTTMLSRAGMPKNQFSFRGFYPRKSGEQKKELRAFEFSGGEVWVWFESPKRISSLLKQIEALPFSTFWAIGKELTKKYEKIWRGVPSDVFPIIKQDLESEGERGEWVVLGVCTAEKASALLGSEGWVKTLKCLRDCGVSQKDAVKAVSQYFGVSRNQIYDSALEIFSEKSASKS